MRNVYFIWACDIDFISTIFQSYVFQDSVLYRLLRLVRLMYFLYLSDILFIIQRIYSKRYAYVTFDCVYVWSPSGGSVRHTFRVPGTGFPWDKIQGRGWNIATALIVTLSLVRTSAKQMSHRSRSADPYLLPCQSRENYFSRLK